MGEVLKRFSNWMISAMAGIASFVLTLAALLTLRELDEKLFFSASMGVLALLVVWIVAERPNSAHGRAISALVKRLLAVRTGDFSSPAPPEVQKQLPTLASAVDTLFEQVRTNIDHVQAIALYDPVTSLPNRVFFKREGEKILAARGRHDQAAMLFIDLDGFKEVNDSLGHAQGDQVLSMVANRLRHVVKAHIVPEGQGGPIIARLAGDEFTLLFPSVSGEEEARRIADDALAALADPFHAGSQSVQIGGSIGVALSPAHAADLQGLMKAADIAMYHAKANGRSCICMYDESLAAAYAERAETERALRQALLLDEFSLVYQPQLCARTGAAVAAEALLRWDHPHGVRMPGTFIPIAEESSLILGIGDWVMDAVSLALARWQDAGMTQRLAFNISPRQIERPSFFLRLRDAIRRSGAPANMLELEVTETMVMRCSETVIAELAALREEGVIITIDDFGSGYSNLARMKDMPLDRVKVDRSLIHDIDTSENARTIVAAVIHLIHGLGLEVVAEGVERKEQLDVLKTIGCDTFQGFAFADPMPEADFFAWVGERRAASA